MGGHRMWAKGFWLAAALISADLRAQGSAQADAGQDAPPTLEGSPEVFVQLGGVGSWGAPAPWKVEREVGVDLRSDQLSPAAEGPQPEQQAAPRDVGYSRVFTHPGGATVTVMGLPWSQGLSLKRLAGQLSPGFTERVLERHGELLWWHTGGAEGDDSAAYVTGQGGKTVLVLVDKVSTAPQAELDALLAGLELSREVLHIDETWIAFDLPADIAYVHRDSSPFSWTRGEGIAAVDVTFDRAPEQPWQTSQKLEPWQDALPGWTLIADVVKPQLKGMQAFEQATAELNGAQPVDVLRALVAAPGSRIGVNAVSFTIRNGGMKVELRAEGADAELIAHNDLIPLGRTLELKDHYDWFYDARRMRHQVSRALAEDVLDDAMPALVELAALTSMGMQEGFGATTGSGLSVVQALPIVGFQLFEIGKARTPTEDSVVANLGYIPSSQLVLRDYFDHEGANFGTSVKGIGTSVSQNTRFFRQRGEVGVNWGLYWPQDGVGLSDSDGLLEPWGFGTSPSYEISDGVLTPTVVRLRGHYLLDPTTWLIPHRFGSFGDFHAGVGLGVNFDFTQGGYTDPNGAAQDLLFYNIAFTPLAGFHTRLFWGALHLSAQGYWTPAQLGLINVARDSAARSQLEIMSDSGQVPDLGELFLSSGVSGLWTTALGTARFDGAKGVFATAVVGVPVGGPRGNLDPLVKWAFAKDAGQIPPLGAKRNRYAVVSGIGVGLTFFFEETRYVPLTTAWQPDGQQRPFGLVNTGLIIGLGSTNTNLPSFGTGNR